MKKKLIDLLDRAGATFAQAFLAVLVADASGITQPEALKVAAVAGGFAVAKWLLAQASKYLENAEKEYVPPRPPAPPAS